MYPATHKDRITLFMELTMELTLVDEQAQYRFYRALSAVRVL